MKIYDVLELLNNNYTPNTRKFFDYATWTSDDNGGFLRTCYRKKDKPLKDYDLGTVTHVVVGFQDKFDPNKLITFPDLNFLSTKTKMQIIFIYSKGQLEGEIEWCKCLTPVDIQVFEL